MARQLMSLTIRARKPFWASSRRSEIGAGEIASIAQAVPLDEAADQRAGEGPRRVGERELIDQFNMRGWLVEEVAEARFETNIHPSGARAWLATFTRLKNH